MASPKFGIPYLSPNQANGDVVVNQAINFLEAMGQLAIQYSDNDPPVTPVNGQAWLVGPTPTGAWVGQAHGEIALYWDGWYFRTPREGMKAWDKTILVWYTYIGGSWIVPSANIAALAGGATLATTVAAFNTLLANLKAGGFMVPD